MKKYKDFSVVLHTALGPFLISDASLTLPKDKYGDILTDDADVRHKICNSIVLEWPQLFCGWNKRPSIGRMCLGYAIWGDVMRFVKWNKEHDERHQIKIESLELHQVILTPHANKVQMHWLFNGGRSLLGLPNTPQNLYVCGDTMATWPDDEFTVYF